MWHGWGRREVTARFWWENVREKVDFEDLGAAETVILTIIGLVKLYIAFLFIVPGPTSNSNRLYFTVFHVGFIYAPAFSWPLWNLKIRDFLKN
jgi:hypothetical protein